MPWSFDRVAATAWAAMALSVAACSSGGDDPPAPRFVIAPSGDVEGPPTVTAMGLDPATGLLSGIASQIAAGSDGYSQVVAADPSRRHLYVGVKLLGVMAYSFDATTGRFLPLKGNPVTTVVAGAEGRFPSPAAIILHPSGRWMFVSHEDSTDRPSPVDVLAVDPSTGALSSSTMSGTLAGARASAMALSRDGRVLYVGSSFDKELHAFSFDDITGVLEPLAGSPYPLDFQAFNLLAHPHGRWLISFPPRGDEMVAWPLVPGTGVPLTDAAVRSRMFELVPPSVALDPLGRFAYVPSRFGVNRVRIDAATGTAESDMLVELGSDVSSLLLSPDGTRVYALEHRGRVFTVEIAVGGMKELSRTPMLVPALSRGTAALW